MDNITGNELDCTSEETEVFTVVTHLIKQIQIVCCVAVIAVHVALERSLGTNLGLQNRTHSKNE
ncbi:hypothetical protein RHGRI_033547 [Rhododendron griersonianum]|uniref:Uncharacterized protein n=1 Tax=Rhododendron griersonianum TaxID=479676 RepID=A0AAV6HY74_9ERIC|nr:hypothetical protein RHGRI_033547 [Rhododendron griersonianum]